MSLGGFHYPREGGGAILGSPPFVIFFLLLSFTSLWTLALVLTDVHSFLVVFSEPPQHLTSVADEWEEVSSLGSFPSRLLHSELTVGHQLHIRSQGGEKRPSLFVSLAGWHLILASRSTSCEAREKEDVIYKSFEIVAPLVGALAVDKEICWMFWKVWCGKNRVILGLLFLTKPPFQIKVFWTLS